MEENSDDLDWEAQLRDIEEAEKWESCADKIPDSLKEKFSNLFSKFSGSRRIMLYKLMNLFEWEDSKCLNIYNVLIKCPNDNIDWLLKLIFHYFEEHSHSENKDIKSIKRSNMTIAFTFISNLNKESTFELVSSIDILTFDFIMNLIKYIPDSEITKMTELINFSNFNEILKMLNDCNEPFAKHCRLCRVKRVSDLEFCMLHNNSNTGSNVPSPENMIRVTGCLKINNKHEIWKAADEKDFSFDFIQGKVFWREKNLVDLIRICDNCLKDVNQAITSTYRFEPIYNIFLEQRKHLLQEIHSEEERRAGLFAKISIEMHRRRIRDFALRALECQRFGLKSDREAALRRENEERRKHEVHVRKTGNELLLSQAMSVDEKWKSEEARAVSKVTQEKRDFSSVKYHLKYDRMNDNNFTPDREHPHSWLLKGVDKDGIGISPDVVSNQFGTANNSSQPELQKLTEWKVHAQSTQATHLNRQKKLAEETRIQEVLEYKANIDLMHAETRRIERQKKILHRTLELEEETRLARRAADREDRRLVRISGYEQNERLLMEVEDEVSRKLRFLMFERGLEDREGELMYDEECEQTEVDRFWGFDLFDKQKQEQIQQLKKYYLNRVKVVNEMLARTENIRPFKLTAVDNIDVDFKVDFVYSSFNLK